MMLIMMTMTSMTMHSHLVGFFSFFFNYNSIKASFGIVCTMWFREIMEMMTVEEGYWISFLEYIFTIYHSVNRYVLDQAFGFKEYQIYFGLSGIKSKIRESKMKPSFTLKLDVFLSSIKKSLFERELASSNKIVSDSRELYVLWKG